MTKPLELTIDTSEAAAKIGDIKLRADEASKCVKALSEAGKEAKEAMLRFGRACGSLEALEELKVEVSKREGLNSKPSALSQNELYDALRALTCYIETCGASPQLTNAVSLASDICQAVGNQYNPPNEAAAKRVRKGVVL